MNGEMRLKAGTLLNERGELTQTGWAGQPVLKYEKKAVRAGKRSGREWERVLIMSDRYALELEIRDKGKKRTGSLTVTDAEEKWSKTLRWTLAAKEQGQDAVFDRGLQKLDVNGKNRGIHFEIKNGMRRYYGAAENFRNKQDLQFDVTIAPAAGESFVTAVPMGRRPVYFRYGQISCGMRAKGVVMLGGNAFLFAPSHSFAVLDRGCGVWHGDRKRRAAVMSTEAEEKELGFSVEAGTEKNAGNAVSALFHDGRVKPPGEVTIEPEKDMEGNGAWRVRSENGEINVKLEPLLDYTEMIPSGLWWSRRRRIWGIFAGEVTTEKGNTITIRERPGCIEIDQ